MFEEKDNQTGYEGHSNKTRSACQKFENRNDEPSQTEGLEMNKELQENIQQKDREQGKLTQEITAHQAYTKSMTEDIVVAVKNREKEQGNLKKLSNLFRRRKRKETTGIELCRRRSNRWRMTLKERKENGRRMGEENPSRGTTHNNNMRGTTVYVLSLWRERSPVAELQKMGCMN